jgi:tryptophan synthase alpha chain
MTNRRFEEMFDRCADENRGAQISFAVLGAPDARETLEGVDRLVDDGADGLELCIPFTDPVAVSPPVAEAIKEALEAGTRPSTCLEMIASIRDQHPAVPIAVMTFANIPASQGVESLFGRLAEAGADAVRIPDLSSLEAGPYAEAAEAAGLSLVLHAPPNASEAQLERIAELSRPYTSVVGLPGQTGEDIVAGRAAVETVGRLNEMNASPPVVSFGVETAEQAEAAVAAGAAGVVRG